MMPEFKNRLARETSPYLLQHQHNPVDWYPWGEEALQQAREQDRPILLSIGYSACHWCHVMAHESFEDPQTAAVMNDLFINIKVDREERPDLDKIYQMAHQLLTRRGGGWPLTVFLMPQDQVPFFAGTYFPPKDRYGMRSFRAILQAVARAYQEKRLEIDQQNDSLLQQLQQLNQSDSRQAELTTDLYAAMSQQLLDEYDKEDGGFTPKPKFPHAYFIERCFRQHFFSGHEQQALLEAGLHTLKKMVQGGLFDQLGGGFCRYSTDEQWMIPHFEKMLYDNGQLMPLYVWANQIRPNYYFKRGITLTAEWLLREMQSESGGFYSAQDADSEGEEGRYYVWQPKQVKSLLDETDFNVFASAYGLDRPANFEGNWYPHTRLTIQQLAKKIGIIEREAAESLERSRKILLQHRSQRIPPGTDDKLLTSWNALMIRGLLIASRALDNEHYAVVALKALQFIRRELWTGEGLLASFKNAEAKLNAYLDDYAYLLLAVIDALQTDWNIELYEWSLSLADAMLEKFSNPQTGGFYFTSHDHEQLILRSQSFNDDAMPSGNAIAAQALFYLGFLSGKTHYIDAAERTVTAASMAVAHHPMGHAAMMNAVDIQFNSATIIILRGPKKQMQRWRSAVFHSYLPDVLCFSMSDEAEVPESMKDKKALEGEVTAYICQGLVCHKPVTELYEFRSRITGQAG